MKYVIDFLMQNTIIKEAMDLLKLSLDSCKFQSLPLILLYDEIVILLEQGTLQPAILEWYVSPL